MNYEIPEVAEFTEEIERLETSTPGHAKFFNAIYEKIFHNTLFLRAKTAILESEIAKSIAIALGRNQALVFNTYDDMAAWFSDAANAENVAGLANGTNLYIIAKDVPDYWWSSVHQKYYELETQKVDLTKYDNIIGDTDISDIGDGTLTSGVKALNNNLGEINSNITATDGSKFRYAVTDDGKPGCIVTGKDGADTVFPFSDFKNLKVQHGGGTSGFTINVICESDGKAIMFCGSRSYFGKIYFRKNGTVFASDSVDNTIVYLDRIIDVKKGDKLQLQHTEVNSNYYTSGCIVYS
jgi:hypothetical protein